MNVIIGTLPVVTEEVKTLTALTRYERLSWMKILSASINAGKRIPHSPSLM